MFVSSVFWIQLNLCPIVKHAMFYSACWELVATSKTGLGASYTISLNNLCPKFGDIVSFLSKVSVSPKFRQMDGQTTEGNFCIFLYHRRANEWSAAKNKCWQNIKIALTKAKKSENTNTWTYLGSSVHTQTSQETRQTQGGRSIQSESQTKAKPPNRQKPQRELNTSQSPGRRRELK